MSGQGKLTEAMIATASAARYAAGGVEDRRGRAALDAAFAQEDGCTAGDEVECVSGGMTGVIVAIDGEDAQISWSCRGESVEHLCNLADVQDRRRRQARRARRPSRVQEAEAERGQPSRAIGAGGARTPTRLPAGPWSRGRHARSSDRT
jgi:hypothetical protein